MRYAVACVSTALRRAGGYILRIPVRERVQPSILRQAAELAERGVPCAIATVVAATGSVPGKVGATMLVTVDGTSRGTVGGAGLEERVKKLCVEALKSGTGGVHTFDLARWKEEGLDSLCGGTVEIAISLVQPTPHLLLIGAGHCSRALAQLCDVLEWGYTVVDSRADYATTDAYPSAREVACGSTAGYIDGHEDLSRFTHAYVMGHSHAEDAEALLALLARGFPGTIGVIGSKAKMHAFRERATDRGLDASRVHCPIGLDIGARTPPEIAVAVAAEILRDMRAPTRDRSVRSSRAETA